MIVDADEFRVYRMRLLPIERLVLPKAAELGMRVLHAEAGDGGWLAKLDVPETERLDRFRSYCTDRDVEFGVKRLYHADDDWDESYGLSSAQRDTLLAAYRAGYFEEPRDPSLQDVADGLGVSQSAASGRLRRAVSALVAATLAPE